MVELEEHWTRAGQERPSVILGIYEPIVRLGGWRLGMARRFVLRLFMGAKHMTANVVDGYDGRVVASASTVEHAIIDAFEWGRGCNAKAAASIGEVLAMRLKTEEPVFGMGGRVHIDVENVIEKKGLDSGPKVWAVVNALRKRGVKVVVNSEPTI